MEAVANIGGLVALIGLVMVMAALISLATKRLLGLSDEVVNAPRYRRSDTSGLSYAIHWLRPGLLVMLCGVVVALVAQAW